MQNFLVLSRKHIAALSMAVGVGLLVFWGINYYIAHAASIGTYDQCSQDDGDGYASGDTGCRWINGNLNSNNSTYFEGDSTVQRMWIKDYAPGTTHTVTFRYGTTKAGTHAYDYLTNWNASEPWISDADRCDGIVGCETVAETTLAMQDDPNASDVVEPAAATRLFTARGGTLNSVTAPTIVSGSYLGDSETEITVSFTLANAGDMCITKSQETKCGIVIWFGAHVAKTSEWQPVNGTTGAGFISGSPYHVQLAAEDGASVGNRDNQMQSNTLPSQIIIRKVTDPVSDPQAFTFTKTGNGNGYTSPYNLIGGNSNTQTVTPRNNQNTYVITEGAVAQWNLTNITCQDNSTITTTTVDLPNRQVTIVLDIDASSIVDCTFSNTKQQNGTLTLQKTVVNDNGGTALDTDWTLSANGPTPISGVEGNAAVTNASVNAGSYNLSESSGPAGYTNGTTWVCTGGTQGDDDTVSVAPGENVVCTITNNDIPAHLIVIKHVINDNGGSAVASGFTTTISGVTTATPSAPGAEAPGVDNTLTSVGAYSVDEGAHVGYTKTLSQDCTRTIAIGETKTCTITNDDIAPTLTLVKTVENNFGGNAVANDFQGKIDGNSVAWNVATNVTAGAHTASETNLTGYTAGSWSGDCATDGSVTLALGENKTCTITNTDQPAHIILNKVVINDNGGTAGINDFGLTVGGSAVTSGSNTQVNSNTAIALNEAGLAGYDFVSLTGDAKCPAVLGGTVTLNEGETVTCTITNNDKAPKLHLRKVVVNDNGGTATEADFTLTANGTGSNDLSGTSPVDSGAGLLADTFELSENSVAGYSASDWVCVGGTQNGANITLGLDQEVTCTITNDDISPTLTLIKHVVNDNGGTKVVADFVLKIDSTVVTSGASNNVNAGAHTASEISLPGYTASDWVCVGGTQNGANITLGLDQEATCTITNNDIAPKLTLVKTVVNDNGGTKEIADFPLFINGNGVTSGVKNDLLANVLYTATETSNSGYTASVWGGDCTTTGTITLQPGDDKTCTITNDDKSGKLIVHKVTDPASDTTTQFSITASGTGVISGNATQNIVGGGTVEYTVDAGTYGVAEAVLAGWDETSNTCVGVVVSNGGTGECTITNTKRGHIIVKKNAIPDSNNQAFTFTNNFGNGNQATFDLTDTTDVGLPSYDGEVLPGKYSVSEGAVTGWQQESAVCDLGETVDDIDVAAGETVTCTFINEKLAKITLVKNTVGGNGTFDFVMTGDTLPGSAQFVTSGGTANQVFDNIDPDNTYSIAETPIPSGWAKTNAVCDNGDLVTEITPNAGEEITCTFTNNKPGAQIDVNPLSAYNKVGDPHQVTATVKVHNGDGSYVNAPNGTLVTFSLVNNNNSSTFVGGVSTCTTTSGVCSVSINTSNTGSVEIHASASPEVLGVTVNVETNGQGDNSENGLKTYVNAKISITPPQATNEVGDAHEYVVTVEENTGSGFVPVPEGTVVNAIVSPATSLDVTDCNNGVNALGQCTVIIDSNVAGVFTITARSTVSVNGVEFKLQTNGNGENSAPATKTFVDGSIAITPQQAVNNINDPHEFTATVSKNDGTGMVPAEGVTVTFAVTSGSATFVGNDNDCITNASGVCSVQINSATPGSNVIDATATFSVGGVSLIRSTSGNSGPGGSDSAVKDYVAGKIIVVKQTLPDGSAESFTFAPSYNSGVTFNLTDGQSNNSGFIAPGTYSVAETVPAGWDLTSAICDDGSVVDVINLSANETVTCTFTNTQRGSLDVTKDLVVTGYLFPVNINTSFIINVSGPSYPLPTGTDLVFNVVNGVVTPATQSLTNIIPGTYTVTEPAPGVMWTVSGTGNVEVAPGGTGSKSVTNTIKLPSTTITLTPDVLETTPGGNVTLTITDTNNGAVPITSPSVQLLANNIPTATQPAYVSGDVNNNLIMDVGETWTWTWTGVINVETIFTVNGIGTDPLGNPVNGPTYASETTSKTIKVIGATRTIGFWQTHTTFTTSVFANQLGGNITIGVAPHKGQLTEIGQVFGGFYAPIAKTTTGAKRSPVDQARIQMLQQLLAAKLNCAAFGCSNAIQTLITNSDSAYAAGNRSTIISLAGQLDAYNNSGDAIAIDPNLPTTGKATPKTSQSLANLSFWNNP